MKAVATATPQSERKSSRERTGSAPQQDLPVTDHSEYGSKIYRKASCACGGGCPTCQANKIDISQPSDAAEVEADAIADKVMRMPASETVGSEGRLTVSTGVSSTAVHRKCSSCEDGDEKTVYRKSLRSSQTIPSQSPSHVRDAVSSGGRALDANTRDFFEPRFGHNLSHVRVHTGSAAEASTRAIDARAYTLNSNVVFGSGEYRPESWEGRLLIAHELAHVIQASGTRSSFTSTLYRRPRTKTKDVSPQDAQFVMRQIMEIVSGVSNSDPAKWKGHPLFDKHRDLFVLWFELKKNKDTKSGEKLEGNSYLSRFEDAKEKTQPFLTAAYKTGGGEFHDLLAKNYQSEVTKFEARASSEKRILELAASRQDPSRGDSRRTVAPPVEETSDKINKPSAAAQAEAELLSKDQPQAAGRCVGDDVFASVSADPLYFAPIGMFEEGCTGCHPSVLRPRAGPVPKPKKQVNENQFLEWAKDYVWIKATDGSKRKKPIFRLLQYKEDKLLDKVWDSYLPTLTAIVTSLHIDDVNKITIDGSSSAKCRFAAYLNASWSTVKGSLSHRAEDLFVEEIRAILSTRAIIPGSSLITDPVEIRKIVENPVVDEIALGRWGATAKTGFEWSQKRLVSVVYPTLYYELPKYPGIFFEVSAYTFQKTDPFVGKVISDVANNTAGMAIVGKFVQGFLNALFSPVVMALDTAARVLDMATMTVSYVNQKMGWHDLGYTCVSSTCRGYEECVKTGTGKKCADDALQAALEEATMIIPIIRQADECFSGGDPEACGGIAALGLGLIKMPETKGSKIKTPSPKGPGLNNVGYQEVLIRDAIKRPRPGDPVIPTALEKSKGTRTKGKSGVGEIVTAAEEIRKTAEANKISPKKLAAEVEEMRSNAKDPENVRRSADEAMDAEMTSGKNSADPHEFKRDREKRTWCRRSTEVCNLNLGEELNVDVDVAVAKKNAREFKNTADLQQKGWLDGKSLNVDDPLPDGYTWNNGKIFRKSGMVDKGYAPLTLIDGKLAIRPVIGRISNSSTMWRNLKAALAEKIKEKNTKWSEDRVAKEVGKIVEKSTPHHLIPDNLVQDTPLGAAALEAGYQIDRGSNLQALKKSAELTNVKKGDVGHWSSHINYDRIVRSELEKGQARIEADFGSLKNALDQEKGRARILEEMKKIEDDFRSRFERRDTTLPIDKETGRITEVVPERTEEELEEAYA